MSDKSITKTVFFTLIVPLLLLFGCNNGTRQVTGGFETTNGITVSVSSDKIEGKTHPRTQIIISDTGWCPIEEPKPEQENNFSDSICAGENGRYAFTNLKPGIYNLIARREDRTMGCLIRNIRVDPLATPYIDSSFFDSLGKIDVSVSLFDTPCSMVCVYIKGTTIWDSTSEGGYCSLENVPFGCYQISAFYNRRIKNNTTDVYENFSARSENLIIEKDNMFREVFLDLKLKE